MHAALVEHVRAHGRTIRGLRQHVEVEWKPPQHPPMTVQVTHVGESRFVGTLCDFAVENVFLAHVDGRLCLRCTQVGFFSLCCVYYWQSPSPRYRPMKILINETSEVDMLLSIWVTDLA